MEVLTEWIYRVEHLLTGALYEAHSRRLRFYDDASLDITEDIKDYVQDTTMCYEIKELCDLRDGPDGQEILVHWLGFEDHERTWESLESIQEAVPKLVKDFLKERNSG